MALAAEREEALMLGIGLGEAAQEALVHLVGLAGDARPDRGGDSAAPRAAPLHLRHRRLDHPAQRALPAGMGGGDHARLAVGEQDRRAVGGEDSEHEARPVGDHRVGLGPGVVRQRAR